MIVLVCGGREYSDKSRVFETLDRLHAEMPFTLVVHGAARGADNLAMLWAASRKVRQKPVAAKWSEYGKIAGSIRNQLMIDTYHPELVVAFPGGTGTADMKERAFGIRIVEIGDYGATT